MFGKEAMIPWIKRVNPWMLYIENPNTVWRRSTPPSWVTFLVFHWLQGDYSVSSRSLGYCSNDFSSPSEGRLQTFTHECSDEVPYGGEHGVMSLLLFGSYEREKLGFYWHDGCDPCRREMVYVRLNTRRNYLGPDEDEPYCSANSKRFPTKFMFLAVVARPCWNHTNN